MTERPGNESGAGSEAPECENLLGLWRVRRPSVDAQVRLRTALVAEARVRLDEVSAATRGTLSSLLPRCESGDPWAWMLLFPLVRETWGLPGDQDRWSEIENGCLVLASRAVPLADLVLTLRLHRDVQHPPDDAGTDGNRAEAALNTRLERLRVRLARFADPADIAAGLGLDILLAPPAVEKAADAVRSEEDRQDGPAMRVLLASPPPTGDRDFRPILDRIRTTLDGEVPLAPAPDPDDLCAALEREFPWFGAVVERVHDDLLLGARCGRTFFGLSRPLLLAGPPGVGKTRFAHRLSRLAGLPMGMVNAAGASDNRLLQGTARGWGTVTPSLPVLLMLRDRMANPLVLVDEVDKAGGSDRNGRLHHTLLSMLEPSSSRRWPDEALAVAVDLSRVVWLLTANDTGAIPALLMSRLAVVEVGTPRARDFDALFAGCLADAADDYECAVAVLPEIDPTALDAMREGFVRGRLQARQLAALVRRALVAGAKAERKLRC